MDKSLLSEEDQNEILMGLYSISAIPHLNSAHMLQRLTALFDHKLDWIEFNFSPWGSIPLQERELFNQVKQAILTNQLITFHYVNSDGEKSIPTVEPQKLIFKNSTWYFKGYIHDDPDRREFDAAARRCKRARPLLRSQIGNASRRHRRRHIPCLPAAAGPASRAPNSPPSLVEP